MADDDVEAISPVREVTMVFRVTDSVLNNRIVQQTNTQRQRIATAQEQIASGKRINRPSDDPFGAATVIDINTNQSNLSQFQKAGSSATTNLDASDNALSSYGNLLGRAQALLGQGLSSFTSSDGRQAIAKEIDTITSSVLDIANQNVQGVYLFGGTRQDVPPFDNAGNIAATPTSNQTLQITPNGQPISIGLTAESIFTNGNNTIFSTLKQAATALRGTGNPAADDATLRTSLSQLKDFFSQANVGQTQIGLATNAITNANNNLQDHSLALGETLDKIESADFVKAATDLAAANNALNAIIQTKSASGQRSLLDILA